MLVTHFRACGTRFFHVSVENPGLCADTLEAPNSFSEQHFLGIALEGRILSREDIAANHRAWPHLLTQVSGDKLAN